MGAFSRFFLIKKIDMLFHTFDKKHYVHIKLFFYLKGYLLDPCRGRSLQSF